MKTTQGRGCKQSARMKEKQAKRDEFVVRADYDKRPSASTLSYNRVPCHFAIYPFFHAKTGTTAFPHLQDMNRQQQIDKVQQLQVEQHKHRKQSNFGGISIGFHYRL